ncbi:MAG TPA: CHAT domain-containing tetratricopeptide repeat protein [Cyclobacteriaceae bacterium]|nr:CHAT domain-containing tetratricopeptide repeat protein [Cyclobacteriaceae bacterium]
MSFVKPLLSLIFVGIAFVATGQGAEEYFELGKKYLAEYKFDSAIVCFGRSKALSPGSLTEARACQSLGDIFKYDLYNFDEAEKNYQRALELWTTLSPADTRGLTRLYYNLATTNRSQRDYETSISWCLKAVEGSLIMKDNAYLERSYVILGNIYRDMGRYDSAVVYYRKGVAVNNEINKGDKNETLAGLYSGWGDANYQQGKIDDAARLLRDAINIYQSLESPDKSIYLHTVRMLAQVCIERYDLDQASFLLATAEELKTQLNLQRGGPVAAFYRTYGDYMMKTGNYNSALGHYQTSLQATTLEELGENKNPSDFTKVDFKDFAYDALLSKAEVLIATKHFDEALDYFSLAEKLMIASRKELDTEDAKWNYVDASFRLYENALSALHELNDPSHADLTLHFMESSKSKSLADALQEVELRKVLGPNDTLLAKLRSLREHSLKLQHQINEKDESSVRDQLIRTTQQISAVEGSLNSIYPSYVRIRNENISAQLPDLKAKVRKADAVFVEYFWGYDNIYAIVVSDDISFYRLGSSKEGESLINSLVALLTDRVNHYSTSDVASFANTSYTLYRALIQPFEEKLPGRKRLVVVPDGPLIQVPFETLVTQNESPTSYSQLNYLIKTHIVSYGFSGSYFANERKAARRNPSLLAFGFTGQSDVRSPDPDRPEIAGSETELIALSNKFPKGTFLYGGDVTEEKFKKEADKYDMIHLAVHGSSDTNRDYAATFYFRDADGPEDGRLYWYELYSMNLKASLAVLSSCESGIGKTYRGEGMLSMANAFTFAGCSNVVMGLWKVDDQVSVRLMDTFYSELLEGMAIDEALALAKRAYLASADQVSGNPKLWGSLVAYGEAQVVKPDELHTGWFILAVVVLIAGIYFLIKKAKKD